MFLSIKHDNPSIFEEHVYNIFVLLSIPSILIPRNSENSILVHYSTTVIKLVKINEKKKKTVDKTLSRWIWMWPPSIQVTYIPLFSKNPSPLLISILTFTLVQPRESPCSSFVDDIVHLLLLYSSSTFSDPSWASISRSIRKHSCNDKFLLYYRGSPQPPLLTVPDHM